MSKKILISNATAKSILLSYRMPGEQVQILEVRVQPFALNNEVNLPTEAHYLEFKKQNAEYFDGVTPMLIEGKASEAKVEKIYTKIKEEAQNKITAEVKEQTQQVADIAEEYTGKSIEVTVEKVQKTKPSQRKAKR